jgi:hypothetical protein
MLVPVDLRWEKTVWTFEKVAIAMRADTFDSAWQELGSTGTTSFVMIEQQEHTSKPGVMISGYEGLKSCYATLYSI